MDCVQKPIFNGFCSSLASPELLILESPDPGLATFYREIGCPEIETKPPGSEPSTVTCFDRSAAGLGQRAQLGKILMDWEEKQKKKKIKKESDKI